MRHVWKGRSRVVSLLRSGGNTSDLAHELGCSKREIVEWVQRSYMRDRIKADRGEPRRRKDPLRELDHGDRGGMRRRSGQEAAVEPLIGADNCQRNVERMAAGDASGQKKSDDLETWLSGLA